MRKYAPNTALYSRVSLAALDVRPVGATHPINTLSAPSGVTNIAGANAYAAKFAISPNTTATVREDDLFPTMLLKEAHSSLYHPTTTGS